jgi:CBS domain-containing protein
MNTGSHAAARESTAGEAVEREAFHVEPVVIEPVSPKTTHPPPPPSLRAKNATGHWQRMNVEGHPKLAQDLMTRRIFTIGQDDILEHLEEQMQAFRFRHLPVVENNKLIGLITHADLLRASSTFLSDKATERNDLIHKLPAKHIMQRELTTVRPTQTLNEVAIIMWEARIGCVPVTEEDGTLVGIITEADFIRLAYHFLPRDLPSGSWLD